MKTPIHKSLYEEDFYRWTQAQASILRSGALVDADSENIAEEIESLGISNRRELVSRSTVLIAHRIQWDQRPNERTASWENTIRWQRINIETLLEDSPSLVAFAQTRAYERAYKLALAKAENEMDERVTVEHNYGYGEAMTVRRIRE